MQQTYAKVAGVIENVSVAELVEDALRINAAALSRHDVACQPRFEPRRPEIIRTNTRCCRSWST